MAAFIDAAIAAEQVVAAIREQSVYAVGAAYRGSDDMIRVTLSNGCVGLFPAQGRLYSGADNKPEWHELAEIEISPTGLGLYWPYLGERAYVPDLMAGLWKPYPWPLQDDQDAEEVDADFPTAEAA